MHQDLGAIFKKLFKKKEGSRKREKAFFGSDPREDWQKLVIGFAVINLLMLLWSAYLFWEINKGDIFEVDPVSSSNSDAITRANLKNIITIYEARDQQFKDLRSAKPVTVDPAL